MGANGGLAERLREAAGLLAEMRDPESRLGLCARSWDEFLCARTVFVAGLDRSVRAAQRGEDVSARLARLSGGAGARAYSAFAAGRGHLREAAASWGLVLEDPRREAPVREAVGIPEALEASRKLRSVSRLTRCSQAARVFHGIARNAPLPGSPDDGPGVLGLGSEALREAADFFSLAQTAAAAVDASWRAPWAGDDRIGAPQ